MIALAVLASFAAFLPGDDPIHQSVLQAPLAQGSTGVGTEVAIDGDWLVATSYESTSGSGVHVFRRSGGQWSWFAELGLGAGANFQQVDIDGERLVVAQNSHSGGQVGVFVFDGSAWQLEQLLTSSDGGGQYFGKDASLDGDRLAVSSWGDPEDGEYGQVSIFERQGGQWLLVDPVHPNAGGCGFGYTVDLSGDWLVVTTLNAFLCGVGVPDFYERTANGWVWRQELTGMPAGLVALDGDLALVGTNVLRNVAGVWTWEAGIPPGTGSGDYFGFDYDLEDGRLIYADSTADGGQGATFVYEQIAGVWTQTAKLVATLPEAGGKLGSRVALSGDRVVTGCPPCGVASSGTPPGLIHVHLIPYAPSSYCTAKPNSLGCVPAMGATGTASATSAQPFLLTAAQVLNQKNGILIYGFGLAAVPFQAGVICAGSPIRRTPLQSSGGAPIGVNDCSGSFAFDMNAHVQSGIDPLLVPGVEVGAQYWYRDPADPFGSGLSDAIQFAVCP
ncbi:MAG TPA: hypothetical protein VMT18_03760 [Planctomycetota bacterium]|nr:hypothetical protein [Planctomycetota bacterium]